jgi:ketohexokinase
MLSNSTPENSPILVIGNCIVDQVMRLERYPLEDSEVRASQCVQRLGGNAANSSQILRQLGHPLELVAQLADDEAAAWVRRELEAAAIGHEFCPRTRGVTPLSSVWLSEQTGSRSIVHHRDLPELQAGHLESLPTNSAAWIHIEGRNVATLKSWIDSPGFRRPKGMSLEIEKARDGIEALASAFDCIIVSSHYLRQTAMDAPAVINALEKINPTAHIACTLGKKGLLARERDGRRIELSAWPVDRVVDSTGAGDAFIAGLVSRLARGFEFSDALDFARRVAASKIRHDGMVIDRKMMHE